MEAWNTVLEELAKEIPAPLLRAVIAPVHAQVDRDTLHLHIADDKRRAHIEKHYIGSIERAWQKQVSHGRIRILSEESIRPISSPAAGPMREKQNQEQFLPHPLNRSIVEQLLILRFPSRCLLLEGATASGKTVLLQNLEQNAVNAGWKVYRRTLEAFIGEFALACRAKSSVDFRSQIKGCDLVLIDDLQYLKQSAAQTQEELRHILESAFNGGPHVVLTADTEFKSLPLRPDLLSRLSSAFPVRLHMPDESTRLRLFLSYCAASGVTPDASALLQVRVQPDPRALRGLALRLAVGASVPAGPVAPEQAVSRAADMLRVPAEDILGPGRDRRVVYARNMVIHVLRQLGLGASQIARMLNRKHHTSVLYAMERAERQCEEDLFFKSQCEELLARLCR